MSALIFVSILLLSSPGYYFQAEPAATLVVSDEQPQSGKPFEITFTAKLPAGSTVLIWPDLKREWPALFDLAPLQDLTVSEQGDGLNQYQQSWTVRLWEPGEYITPATRIVYQPPGSTIQQEIVVESELIIVPSVLVQGDERLRPSKPQFDMPYVPPAMIIIGMTIIVNVAVYAYSRWQTQRKIMLVQDRFDIRTLDHRLRTILHRFNEYGANPPTLYNAVATVLRDFLQKQYHIEAHEMTTIELIDRAGQYLAAPHKEQLKYLLEQADLVKFARYRPDTNTARQYLQAASHWLQDVSRNETENAA